MSMSEVPEVKKRIGAKAGDGRPVMQPVDPSMENIADDPSIDLVLPPAEPGEPAAIIQGVQPAGAKRRKTNKVKRRKVNKSLPHSEIYSGSDEQYAIDHILPPRQKTLRFHWRSTDNAVTGNDIKLWVSVIWEGYKQPDWIPFDNMDD